MELGRERFGLGRSRKPGLGGASTEGSRSGQGEVGWAPEEMTQGFKPLPAPTIPAWGPESSPEPQRPPRHPLHSLKLTSPHQESKDLVRAQQTQERCLGPPLSVLYMLALPRTQETGLPVSWRNPGMSSCPSAPSWAFLLHQLFPQEGRPAQPRLSSRAFCLLDLQEIAGAVAKGSSAPGTWGTSVCGGHRS